MARDRLLEVTAIDQRMVELKHTRPRMGGAISWAAFSVASPLFGGLVLLWTAAAFHHHIDLRHDPLTLTPARQQLSLALHARF